MVCQMELPALLMSQLPAAPPFHLMAVSTLVMVTVTMPLRVSSFKVATTRGELTMLNTPGPVRLPGTYVSTVNGPPAVRDGPAILMVALPLSVSALVTLTSAALGLPTVPTFSWRAEEESNVRLLIARVPPNVAVVTPSAALLETL